MIKKPSFWSAPATLTATLTAALMTVLISASGCAKKQKPDDAFSATTDLSDGDQIGDSDSGKALGLETVRFPYDSFTITDAARTVLKNNTAILNDKTSLKIQIEGHCDTRGGIQYNIALGEKRANAIRKYLEGQGISSNRLSTISYGKERLLEAGDSEDAHARNRRANFSITSR
jgi:peptidoglycan-associated lipoprotein